MKIFRNTILSGFILSVIVLYALAQTDSSMHQAPKLQPPPVINVEQETRLPTLQERLSVLGVVIVLFGGLGLILNLKRKVADEDAET